MNESQGIRNDASGARRLVVTLSGRVQGVFFRSSARIRAVELSLTGRARNDEPGSLTIIAEGERGNLERFLEWCRIGPPLARVDEARAEWQDATGEFTDFRSI